MESINQNLGTTEVKFQAVEEKIELCKKILS